MCHETYYHGTHRDRGKRILDNNKMEYSRGNHEWLGDGIYLYRDKLYAYRWTTILYNDHYPRYRNPEEIFEKYMILCVKVDYNYERVFSFMNPEHRIEFWAVKDQIERSGVEIKGVGKEQITDGVILNMMFNDMGYGENYDMVEALFSLVVDRNETGTRLNRLDEYQLCVKNPNKIVRIQDCTLEFAPEEYDRRLKAMNSYRSNCTTRTRKYNTKRGYKYGQ